MLQRGVDRRPSRRRVPRATARRERLRLRQQLGRAVGRVVVEDVDARAGQLLAELCDDSADGQLLVEAWNQERYVAARVGLNRRLFNMNFRHQVAGPTSRARGRYEDTKRRAKTNTPRGGTATAPAVTSASPVCRGRRLAG